MHLAFLCTRPRRCSRCCLFSFSLPLSRFLSLSLSLAFSRFLSLCSWKVAPRERPTFRGLTKFLREKSVAAGVLERYELPDERSSRVALRMEEITARSASIVNGAIRSVSSRSSLAETSRKKRPSRASTPALDPWFDVYATEETSMDAINGPSSDSSTRTHASVLVSNERVEVMESTSSGSSSDPDPHSYLDLTDKVRARKMPVFVLLS
jgi:hypothetical protein